MRPLRKNIDRNGRGKSGLQRIVSVDPEAGVRSVPQPSLSYPETSLHRLMAWLLLILGENIGDWSVP